MMRSLLGFANRQLGGLEYPFRRATYKRLCFRLPHPA